MKKNILVVSMIIGGFLAGRLYYKTTGRIIATKDIESNYTSDLNNNKKEGKHNNRNDFYSHREYIFSNTIGWSVLNNERDDAYNSGYMADEKKSYC